MPALFLSPHLDDVAFSCGATLRRMVEDGYEPWLVTIFTASVPNPKGFALACQTDKGIAPDVDYMALRREEDKEFARLMGVTDVRHWEFAEAPHRGYNSAPELFAGVKEGDDIWQSIAEKLRALDEELGRPQFIFAPQGLGNHVDHLQVIRAVLEAGMGRRTRFYRDTPYAIREPNAKPSSLLDALTPPELLTEYVPVEAPGLRQKIAGCCAYKTQIGFQFGGPWELRRNLRAFHRSEAAHNRYHDKCTRDYAERFLVHEAVWELG